MYGKRMNVGRDTHPWHCLSKLQKQEVGDSVDILDEQRRRGVGVAIRLPGLSTLRGLIRQTDDPIEQAAIDFGRKPGLPAVVSWAAVTTCFLGLPAPQEETNRNCQISFQEILPFSFL